jgi:hypothetical protein
MRVRRLPLMNPPYAAPDIAALVLGSVVFKLAVQNEGSYRGLCDEAEGTSGGWVSTWLQGCMSTSLRLR